MREFDVVHRYNLGLLQMLLVGVEVGAVEASSVNQLYPPSVVLKLVDDRIGGGVRCFSYHHPVLS